MGLVSLLPRRLPVLEVLENRLLLSTSSWESFYVDSSLAAAAERTEPVLVLQQAAAESGAAENAAGAASLDDQVVWFDFDAEDGLGVGAAADVEIVSASPDGLTGCITVPGAWLEPVKLGETKFRRLDLPGHGWTDVIGEPQLPVIRQLLTVPDGAELTAEILGQPELISLGEAGLDGPLAPLQPSVEKTPGSPEAAGLSFDAAAYAADSFAPEANVRLIEAGYADGQRLVLLEVAPISYNPADAALSVYEALTFHVAVAGGEGASSAIAPFEASAPAAMSGGRLLIITHDDFAASLGGYVTHKTNGGWTVDVADTSTAGTTNTAIRGYIQGRYNNPATRPAAVLLVGDTDRIPYFVGSGSASPVTDLYYGCMDAGDDWYPEIPVGRFSVANTAQLADVIEKTIHYETSSAGEWTNDVVFMASVDNYTLSEGTHNWVISHYMDPLGYDSTKLYQVTYGATTADVREAFNAGQAMGVYSGHGGTYSWADGPPFSQSDVRGLTNAGKYPLIASFACITGEYDAGECFMETWLRSADNAAVVAVGSSVSSYWTEDDILEKRLFDAIFDEGFTSIGSAWVRAKELYLDHFGVSSTTRMYFEMYNVLGDPTVEVLGLDFGIRSPSELPLAFAGEPYDYTLQAGSGVEPYTWSLVEGTLPDGLSLETTTGRISGTPTAVGEANFVIQATDAAMATDSRAFHLSVVSELRITTPPELPPAFIGYPYSETLEATGGTTPYTWSILGAGQYAETGVEPSYLGGGSAQGWHADDNYWALSLPWEFNFYGTEYNSVYVSSNGFLNFGSGSSEYSNSQAGLLDAVRIAPLWDDLTTYSPDDIYVRQTADYVAIRWDASTYSTGAPVDFEAVLYRNGDILFNYGAAHSSLSPTIGISAGDNTNYTMASIDGSGSIPAGTSLRFSYAGQLPAGLTFDGGAGRITGTPTETAPEPFELTFEVRDSGVPRQTAQGDFTLEVLDLPPLTVDVPAEACEDDGLLTGTVSIPAAQASNVTVTLVSDDPSEASLPSPTVVILAGRTSADFGLQVVDDTILDGTREATITASAAGFYADSDRIAVHDNETATLTVTVPAEATEGDGVLGGRGTVTVSAAVEGDVVVALSSSDPTEATVPATVTIPAGGTSASFDVTVVDDAEIDGDRTATITAHVVNWPDGSDGIVVHDNDGAISVQLPEKVWEGQGTLAGAGTVVLAGTLPADLVVSLGSDDTTELRVPASVTIPAGAMSATFDLLVQDDADHDGSQLVHVGTTAPGLSGGSGTLHVGDDEVHHFALDPIASPQTAGVPFSVTIAAKDINGETIEVYGGSVDLTGAGDGGPVTIEIDPGSRAAETDADAGAAYVRVFQPEDSPAGGGEKLDLGVYHDYAALTTALQEYAAAHPAISRLVSLGQSVRGRELWAMKITDNPAVEEDEPEVKYVSTIHGDEPVGTEMCLYFIDELLNDYGADPRITSLVDETEIWIVPLMNPDGREAATRGNAHGVDLNRNFPDGAVSPIGSIFDGSPMDTAGREVETVRIMEWSAEQSFTLSANFHTGSLVVNYPYDNDGLGSVFSPTPDEDLFVHVSELYSVHNPPMWNSPSFFHGITNGAAWYTITGGMQDWHYRYLSCNEVTIELSNVFWPAESTLPSYWADNGESMLSYFEAVHMGVRGLVTDAVTGSPVYAAVSVEGNEHRVYTDADVGDYHRMLLPGTYDLTFSAPGYASRTLTGVEVADGAATRLDVPLVPAGAGIVFVDGEWTGEVAVQAVETHVVLAARDGLGHTGSSNAFDVVAGAVDHFEWGAISSPRYVGVPIPVTLTAADANGYPATGFTGDVELGGYVGTGSTSALVISEIDTDETDAIEFTNVSGAPLDVSGWQVTIYDWESWPSPQLTFTIPAGTVCGPDAVFLLQEEGSAPGSYPHFYADGNFYWNNQPSGNPVAAVLRDASGGIADVVCAVDADPALIANPTPIPAEQWQGAPIPANGDELLSYERIGGEDHNDSSDWVAIGRSIGSINDDLTVPFTGGRAPVAITPTAATFAGGAWAGDVTVLEDAPEEMYLRADDGSGHAGESNRFVIEPLPPVTVELPDSATEGDGAISGAVSIHAAQGTDLLVALDSSDLTEAAVPGSVTIPAGLTSVPLTVTILDDAVLDGTKTVRITPTAPGYSSGVAAVAVHDNETAVLTVDLPAGGEEGRVAIATVTLGASAGDDVSVELASNDTTEATVPAAVTVPAGSDTATFPVTLVADGIVDGTQTVTITAHVENWTDGADSMDVWNADLGILAPSELPDGYLGIPYGVTLEATGGTAPYTWSVLGAGAYVESDPGPSYLGGGSARGWHADDSSWSLALPWGFEFYGTVYDSVWVCSNGFLDFTSNTADYTNSISELLDAVRIAVLWDDLDTYDPHDIYVTQTDEYVAVRWDAELLGGGPLVDAEIVLYRSGDILFNYGAAHSGFTPTMGISAGDNVNYTVASIDGSSSIPADTSLLFHYGGQLPDGLTLNEATGEIGGTPTELGAFELTFQVCDSGVPRQTARRDFTLEISDVAPLVLDVPAEAAEGGGVVYGTVSLPAPSAAAVVVSAASDDTSEVSPASPTVTIPVGQTSATLSLSIRDDAILDATQTATITVSAAGYLDASGRIAVHDNETATLAVDIPAGAIEDEGVLAGAGTVTVSAAPQDDVTVHLSSDDMSEVTVPAAVTIPAGRTSAEFDVILVDDAEIDGTQTASVTAHVQNWTDGADAMDVEDNDGVVNVLLPAKVWEGYGTLPGAGTVTLAAALRSDLEVSLLSDDTTELSVPATVVIPAGHTAVPFDLIVQDDADYDGTQAVRVTSSAPGLDGGSGRTEVGDDDVHHYAFEPIGDPQTASVAFPAAVTARDVNDELIVVYAGAALGLTGAGDGGAVAVEPAETGAFAAGGWFGEVTVHAVDRNVVLTVEDADGATGSSNPFDVVPGAPDHFEWGAVASPQYRDVPFDVTISARDAHGYVVTDFGGIVDLAGWATSSKNVGQILVWENCNSFCLTAALDGLGLSYQSFGDYGAFSTALAAADPGRDLAIVDEAATSQDWAALIGFVNAGGRAILGFWDLDSAASLAAAFDATAVHDMFTPEPVHDWGGSPLFDGLSSPISMVETGWDDDGDRLQPTANGVALAGLLPTPAANQAAVILGNSGLTILNGFLWDNAESAADAVRMASNEIELVLAAGRAPVAVSPTAATFVGGVWTGGVTVLEDAEEMYLLADDGSGHAGESNRFEVQPLPPLTVDVPGSATEGAGILSGTVSIPLPLAADLEVTLRSDDVTEVSLPQPGGGRGRALPGFLAGGNRAARLAGSTTLRLAARQAAGDARLPLARSSGDGPSTVVVIPAGETSATFELEIVDDAILDGSHAATITAAAEGHYDGTGRIVVHDGEHATLSVSVPDSALEGDGLLAGRGSVTVSEAPGDDVTVSLSSGDTTEATVPESVTIPAGQVSATFDVGIVDDAEVDGTRTATITAHVANWTDGADAIDVRDDDGVISVELPESLWEGQGTLPGAGTVLLDAPLTTDVEVSLASDDLTELRVPETVTVPAGRTSATFDLFVQDDGDFDGGQSVGVSATAPGLTGGSAATEVGDNDVHHYAIDPIGSPQAAAVGFPVTVRAKDIRDVTILVYAGGACSLSGAGDGGPVTVQPEVTGAFAGGAWTGGVSVLAVDSHVVLTVEDPAGRSGESNAFDVASGPLDHFEFAPISSPQSMNNPFEVTLTAVDANGYTVTGFGGSVGLGGWVGAGTGSAIVITECHEETPDYVEIQNVSGREIDTSGWVVALNDAESADINTVHDVFWELPETMPAGEVLYRTDDPAENYWGSNIWWGSATSVGWAMVVDDAGSIVDFEVWGYSEAEIASLNVVVNGHPITIGSAWSGPGVGYTTTADHSLARGGGEDHNDAGDFSWAAGDRGAQNPDLTVPFAGGGLPVSVSPTSVTFVGGLWQGDVTVREEAVDMYLEADDGSGRVAVSGPFTVELASHAPGAVVLMAESDTGVPSDRITRLNNASAAQTLRFGVTGTVPGAQVAIYADGVLIGTATAPVFPITYVTTDGVTTVPDGVRTITARQSEAGLPESPDSPGIEVTVDTQSPRVAAFGLSSTYAHWALGTVDSSVWTDGRGERTAPWAVIDRLVVTFDEPVLADADDLAATGGAPPLTGPSASGTDTLTWDAGMYFSVGRYGLLLAGGAGGVQDIAGNALDGDGPLGAFPSGDGAPGGDWAFELNVLIGDACAGDGLVDRRDRDFVRNRYGDVLGWGHYDPLADINGDGVVNVIDRALVRFYYGDVLPPGGKLEAEGAADALAGLPAAGTWTALDAPVPVIQEPAEPRAPTAPEDVSPMPHVDVLSLCRGQLLPRRLRPLPAR